MDALCLLRHAEELEWRTGRCAAGRRAAAKAEGRMAVADAEDALLPAGHAIRPRTELREKLYHRAFVTRASDQNRGDARKFDNTALINEILALRRKKRSCWLRQFWRGVVNLPKMANRPPKSFTSCVTWPTVLALTLKRRLTCANLPAHRLGLAGA